MFCWVFFANLANKLSTDNYQLIFQQTLHLFESKQTKKQRALQWVLISQVAACIRSSPSLLQRNAESLTCHHSRSVKSDNTLCASGGTPSIQGNECVICCHNSYQNAAQEHIIQTCISPALKDWKILSLSSSKTSLGCQLRSQLPWNSSSPGWHWEPSPTHDGLREKRSVMNTLLLWKNLTATLCWGSSYCIRTKRSARSMTGTPLLWYQCLGLLNRSLSLFLFSEMLC